MIPAWYRRALGPGDTGQDVAVLQQLLRLTPDGVYGPLTASKVRLLQRAQGLPESGSVGPSEASQLGDLPSRGIPPAWFARELGLGDAGDDVAAVQKWLGLEPDGGFGPETEHAVRRYQSRLGLTLNGRIDAETAATIGE